MNGDFDWPIPPYFEMVSKPTSGSMEPGLVVKEDGGKVFGHVVYLDPSTSVLEFHPERASANLSIGFANFKSLRLLQPIELRRRHLPPSRDGGEVYPHADKQKCTIRFKDGDDMDVETMGYVLQSYGLFLFLPSGSNKVLRWFLPIGAIKSHDIGEQLGKILVDEKVVSREQLDAGLVKQEQLRSQKLGDYLKREHIVTQEQLEGALKHQKAMPQLKLGEALRLENLITEEQLNQALQTQAKDRKLRLGEILVGMGIVNSETIAQMLVQKLGFPFVSLRKFQFDVNAIDAIPAHLAVKHTAIPLYRTSSRVVVAMENPLAWDSVQELGVYTKVKIEPVLASPEEIADAIQKYYGAETKNDEISDLVSELDSNQEPTEAVQDDTVTESDSALVRLVNKIILDGFKQGVSDIHIESLPGNKPSRVRFRKDGILMPYSEIPAKYRAALVSRIKIMSRLDISEKRQSQDGKMNFEQFGPANIELRVVTMPTNNGLEDVVMRILAAPKAVPIDGLGLSPYILTELKRLSIKPHGLLFVCGPTGSGKTTTLHAVLGYINTPERKIWTAEDPIEISQDGLRQVQVHTKIGWTFATVLRSFLRADPDVIMVGETRDTETAKTVIEASLTGHLVLSTMHTNSAVESVVRLLDLGLDPFNFADALLGVVGQRLARRLCASCRKPHRASDEEMYILTREYCWDTELNPTELLERWRKQYGGEDGAFTLYSAHGCDKCDQTGYKGRLGVHEMLVSSPEVKRKIYARANVREILRTAITEGMRTLRQDGLEKILQGHTDLEQVQAVCM